MPTGEGSDGGAETPNRAQEGPRANDREGVGWRETRRRHDTARLLSAARARWDQGLDREIRTLHSHPPRSLGPDSAKQAQRIFKRPNRAKQLGGREVMIP